ncbi:hypothetical protein GCM10009811_04880 [Nostocoides veronense]|uniref:Transposase n=1 Tax=Nostocoides veronense TaxID=330836 RepID=A0ABP4XGR8_9MICO
MIESVAVGLVAAFDRHVQSPAVHFLQAMLQHGTVDFSKKTAIDPHDIVRANPRSTDGLMAWG